jgi:hypothetical protein
MMSKKARKLAEFAADRHLANAPALNKSAGTRDALIRQYYPLASAVLVALEPVKAVVKRHEKLMRTQLAACQVQLGKINAGLSGNTGELPVNMPLVEQTVNRVVQRSRWEPFNPGINTMPVLRNGHDILGTDDHKPGPWHPEHPLNDN